MTTQLRQAVFRGFTDCALLLLAHGVDPNTRGYHPAFGDLTAFEVAVHCGQAHEAALPRRGRILSGRIDEVV